MTAHKTDNDEQPRTVDVAPQRLGGSAGEPVPALLVIAGPDAGRVHRLAGDTVLGRDERCDLVLRGEGISRRHCVVQAEPSEMGAAEDSAERAASGFRLRDLASRNGTWLNGRPVQQAVLRPRDRMGLGADTLLRFLWLDEGELALHHRLYDAAVHDDLTGLATKGVLLTHLDLRLRESLLTRQPLTLALLDLDGFKQVNDQHGHLSGDRVLAEVAGRLVRAARPTDLVARFGGEEFCVVAPGVGSEAAGRYGDRLRAAVSLGRYRTRTPGARVRVTASVGCAVYTAHGELAPSQLFSEADAALYRAKEAGKDRVEIAVAHGG